MSGHRWNEVAGKPRWFECANCGLTLELERNVGIPRVESPCPPRGARVEKETRDLRTQLGDALEAMRGPLTGHELVQALALALCAQELGRLADFFESDDAMLNVSIVDNEINVRVHGSGR